MNQDPANPIRPARARDHNRLAAARGAGAFVAWRDSEGVLQLDMLKAEKHVTVGRAITNTISFDFREVSRDHLRITRVRGVPGDEAVYILDRASDGGTQQRPVRMENATERPAGPWQRVPSEPARPLHLSPGEHDICLARRVCIRIGGVLVDEGLTHDRREPLEAPTARERELLVELCREQFENGPTAGTPRNAQIGMRLSPAIKPDTVSEVLGRLYEKYSLHATKEQNRVSLAHLALSSGLVGPEDYL